LAIEGKVVDASTSSFSGDSGVSATLLVVVVVVVLIVKELLLTLCWAFWDVIEGVVVVEGVEVEREGLLDWTVFSSEVMQKEEG
jgi:uncharacterized membrane protein YdfJ with MMPL/SSD domain